METAGDEETPLLHHPHPHLYQDGDSRYTCDGTVDVNGQPAVKASTGNWRACFFILGIEFSECLAYFAISKNLVTYLTSVLHESNVDAARNVSTWIGTTFFTPLLGAFLADTYWGRYKTMVIFLSVYTVGMLVLTISTALPWLLQSSNLGGIHRVAIYAGLYLTALGNGGIKPCTSTFGADQFDIADPAERVKKGSFFNWYTPLGESPMTRVSRVVVAAARNCSLQLPDDCSALHHLPSPPSENKKVHHNTQFRFLDKAAIVPSSTPQKKGVVASPWRLCTVPQVEEVKKLLRLCPIWASMVVFFMITSQMSSTLIEQGMAMDNHVGSFAVPPASLSGFYVVTMLVLIPVYDTTLVSLARRATGEDRGLTHTQRIGIGLALSAVAMAYSALLERNRLATALDGEAVSIVWQAPAYAMLGGREVFAVIGMLELFYDRAPGDMRSMCTALSQLAVAAGNYLNSAALGAVAWAGWIPEDLDDGHLDYFFWVMAALGALNLLQFLMCSGPAMRFSVSRTRTRRFSLIVALLPLQMLKISQPWKQQEMRERPLLHRPPPNLHQDGDSRYTNDGTVDVNGQPALKDSTGNWRACFFLLGVQFSECLAFFAISKNLVTYLTSVLHESNIDAARNVSTWFGTTFFTPIIGAFLADTYWGRYKTLVVFLTVYIVGMLVLTVSTTLPWMMQSPNHSKIHRVTVYVGLYLTALGNGGIKPCTSTFGADQFDITDPSERVKKGSFFNWFYFLTSIGSLLSTTVIVWVQDNVGWGIGFVIPMILTSLSFMVFIASRRIYRYKSIGESPMTRASQVVVAAARNRHLELPEDCTTLHHPPSPPSEATFNVHHTTQFRFLEKAAIVSPSTQEKKGAAASPWRLCALSHVEEVKMLLRLCPAWASLVVFFMITAQMSSTVIEQGMAMDNHVGPFIVPPASLVSFNVVTTLVLVPIYDILLVPLARRATGKDRGLTQPQRLGVGLALSTLAIAYLALLERNRLAEAAIGEAVSIMWQVPAYVVMGVSEVFTVIGTLELFYNRAPDNMRSLCTAFAQLAIAAGSYLNSAALGVVASATTWIPEDLDDGHLDYFFWTIGALSALNLLQFVLYSIRYNDNVACGQRHPY